ncbi:intermembrane transport protein PqiB [Granulosicoccus antarcticus]|uniref:PqiB family protein n=1 Tax=Granulosicoccus antarcticus TaxID=437505 RepID=UPI00146F974D|nr:MlaD family protein [Granulosicoccus antarcticus]
MSKRKRISAVWLIPIFALLVGAWFVYTEYQQQGSEVVLHFQSAEGIVVGKTKIRHLSIDVGEVTDVALNESLDAVEVRARMKRNVMPLLQEDTRFWVVRPRVGASGISGLGTLLSGAYISFNRGVGNTPTRTFIGEEEPPVSPASAPGVRVRLRSENGSDMNIGQPVLYKNYRVGQIESVNFDHESEQLIAQLFIEAPYHTLLNSQSRFWNTSGVRIKSRASGFEVETGSLESMLVGGVSFDIPEGSEQGESISDNALFELYPDRESIDQNPYVYALDLIMMYTGSLRGLQIDASVEFRGLQIGNVTEFGFEIFDQKQMAEPSAGEQIAVPIRLRIEPARLIGEDTQENIDRALQGITDSVHRGMRATLRQGNLVTGAQYISFEALAGVGEAQLEQIGDALVIPSQASGIDLLTNKVGKTLDKLNEMPVDAVIAELVETMDSAQQTLRRADTVLADVSADSALYGSMQDSLDQLRTTLIAVDQLASSLKEKPSQLIFTSPKTADRIPRGAVKREGFER